MALHEAAEHMLLTQGFDRGYVINEKGFACEEILDWLADMDAPND